jgi:RNA-binding protein Tab2/Atab2
MTIIWELDFYSRPVLDEGRKKLWEVLICESPLEVNRQSDSLFRYSQFCSNTEVNSVWLRAAIEKAIAQAPQPPDRIRFFRRQMNNMITKACEDAGIPAYPSRRTLALNQWIQERLKTTYPAMENYQEGANPSVILPEVPAQTLPDALIGERWAFVTLEASAFADMPEWDIGFSEAFPPEMFDLSPDTPIPGLIIFSSRALPLAAWMSGLEMAFLRYNPSPPQLVLETGSNDSWILARLSKSELDAEVKGFEVKKQAANQVHFVAVQENQESESFAGFWLMQQLNLA